MTLPRIAIVVPLLAAPITAGIAQEQPGAPPTAPIAEAELLRRTATLLDSVSAKGEFSGVVVIARNGNAVFQRAYGMADRETSRRNTTETAFNLGSINKIFTATAIRQLAADGKVHLDSALIKYLPDYPNPDVARKVTLRQLMTFRSGIGGDIFGVPASGRRHDITHNRDYLPLFVKEPLQFEPGTQQRYSNAGYIILGLVVEAVSGEDYYRYVQRHIYEPAGMTHTAAYFADSLPASVALGYTRNEGASSVSPQDAGLRRNTELLPGRGSAAGGGYSTAQDLLRFAEAMRKKTVPGAPPGGIGAAGGAPGINAMLETDLAGGYDVVVLANLDPPAAERVARTIRGWLGASD